MTDQVQPAGTAPEPITHEQPSAPVTTQQGEAQEKQPAQPQYVTREELDQITENVVRRVKQSDRDRSRRVEEELAGIKALLTKAGTPITPEAEAKIRNQIVDQMDGETEPQPGQSAAPGQAAGPSPVDQFLTQVFAKAGATVTPNDPEWKEIQKSLDDNWNNPNGLPDVLLTANAAAQAKKARTAAMQETAAARVGGGGTTPTGAAPASSAAEMWQQAYKPRT